MQCIPLSIVEPPCYVACTNDQRFQQRHYEDCDLPIRTARLKALYTDSSKVLCIEY